MPDCPYLESARRHPPAIVQRQHELDMALMMPAMASMTERQSRLFLLFQSLALRHIDDPLRPLLDSDVADAASTAASALETAARGLIYEQQPASLNAQQLLVVYRRTFDEVAAHTGGPRTPLEKDAARALRGVEEAARRVGAIVGDPRTGFLALVRRVLGSEAMRHEEAGTPPERGGLILP